ncbi:MAG: phosphoribosylaminoimidazolesuccinocarboxamide synthase [Bdellovibrionaceae bacterium]|nr:phosphoribosylaminoimidazolesuccinocarboxamide synthase [Pseudobdellovibrionaceae bacterium]NUM58774.1 phosphoribosylaminoimidazolesuccinocarboxamide synthase [Pseudobdellovibrionaceae bacterium]
MGQEVNYSELLYEGKAKKIFKTPEKEVFFLEFKDSLTAFNALKKGSFENKGIVNRDIAALVFDYLEQHGVKSHYLKKEKHNGMLVKKVEIIPFEVVVRNVLAGSTAKKLGLEEGTPLSEPLVEFYFKKDELNDPFVSEEQMRIIYKISEKDISLLCELALMINQGLKELFHRIDIELIDFKVEFGKDLQGQILLADEITPDCCRLWDVKTKEKLDKDRFRRDLGQVKESYEQVLARLQKLNIRKG